MPVRSLPVRPDRAQLLHEASELLAQFEARSPAAIADFIEFHPEGAAATRVDLHSARDVLARSYRATNWQRLLEAVSLVEAIWADDLSRVRELLAANPKLLHEMTLLRPDSNWGPPLSYAANLGRDNIVLALHALGAGNLEHALDRAVLQGRISTARLIHELMGRPAPPAGILAGPAYTLNVAGTAFALDLGARVYDDDSRLLAPVAVVLETDSRNARARRDILALYERYGVQYPDTPTMAIHRGRLDLLAAHLERDPHLLQRTFSHEEIYPAAMGCQDPLYATVGTPLSGTSLLHMCIDYDEFEIASWLLDQGTDPDIRSRVGRSGFGGYTPLFCTVVSQPNFWMNHLDRGPFVAPFTDLLLRHGANPNIRASIWKQLHPGYGDTKRREYLQVTALSWGRQFHFPLLVSQPAMDRIVAAGGLP